MKFEHITRIAGFTSLFLMGCSISRSFVYYNSFGVRIFDFAGPAELIGSFIPDALFVLVFVSTSALLSMLADRDRDSTFHKARTRLSTREGNFWRRLRIYFAKTANQPLGANKPIPSGFSAFMMAVVMFAYTPSLNSNKHGGLLFYFLPFAIIVFWLSYITVCEFERIYYKLESAYAPILYRLALIPGLITFFVLSMMLTIWQIDAIKKRETIHLLDFVFESGIVKVNNRLAFLGRTDSYLIFYQVDSMRQYIYPADKLIYIRASKPTSSYHR
jgi:hypothetical protein